MRGTDFIKRIMSKYLTQGSYNISKHPTVNDLINCVVTQVNHKYIRTCNVRSVHYQLFPLEVTQILQAWLIGGGQ